MIREIYLRVLSRDPDQEEIEAIQLNADMIDSDHKNLQMELASRESWWKKERAKREAKRNADLKDVAKQIAAREKAIAPERKKMEDERLAKLAAAEKALADYNSKSKSVAEKYLKEADAGHNWFPLLANSATSTNKDKLSVQQDRSIVATGKAAKGTYVLRFHTPLTNIRGLRLEALPQEGVQGGGPGLPPNGNFVVTELEVRASDLGSKNPTKELKAVGIAAGMADFSQDGFDPKQTFSGNSRDQRGWAVSPRGGTVHWITYQFKEPIASKKGTLLEVKLHQYHNADKHRLAHFRVSVTTDEGELQLGLPEEFAALKASQPAQLDESQTKSLIAYLEKSDKKWQDLKTAVAQAKKPLPEDKELVGLRSRQKLLGIETPDDPNLVQLRTDVAESQKQVDNRRLTLAQDLTWALINSPAFLFNH